MADSAIHLDEYHYSAVGGGCTGSHKKGWKAIIMIKEPKHLLLIKWFHSS